MPSDSAQQQILGPHETPEAEEQIAICTRDSECKAPADGHAPDCPVEAELKATFGF